MNDLHYLRHSGKAKVERLELSLLSVGLGAAFPRFNLINFILLADSIDVTIYSLKFEVLECQFFQFSSSCPKL